VNLGRFAELGNAADELPAMQQERGRWRAAALSLSSTPRGQQKVNNPAPEHTKMLELIWLN
jgi:hypothetical protein